MQHYEYVAADIEFVVNLTNIFSNYRPDRFYNLSPFVGVGYAHAFKDDFKPWINNSAMVSAGILNTFKLSNRFDAFIELSGYLVDEAFDGTGLQGDWQWEGIATGSAGIIVKLGKSTWDQARLWDQGLVDDLNNTINRLREENAQLAKRPKSCPPQVECPVCPECPESRTFVTPGSVEYFPTSVVFFRLNSAVVDKSQEINVYNIARYMQDNPDARIKCVGYADAGTGKSEYNMKLSARRAEAVAKQLINKYGISADRVTTESKGSDEQIYDQNDWNRVVIFFAD
jgi:outer membrane protein OmpA-like peptidoglycan-associated protein